MSSIEQNLAKILSAIYGEDVRQAIHDAIHDCYEDGKVGAVDLVARERIDNLVANAGAEGKDSELVDLRVDLFGRTHDSARDSVVGMVGEINRSIRHKLAIDLYYAAKASDSYMMEINPSNTFLRPSETSGDITEYLALQVTSKRNTAGYVRADINFDSIDGKYSTNKGRVLDIYIRNDMGTPLSGLSTYFDMAAGGSSESMGYNNQLVIPEIPAGKIGLIRRTIPTDGQIGTAAGAQQDSYWVRIVENAYANINKQITYTVSFAYEIGAFADGDYAPEMDFLILEDIQDRVINKIEPALRPKIPLTQVVFLPGEDEDQALQVSLGENKLYARTETLSSAVGFTKYQLQFQSNWRKEHGQSMDVMIRNDGDATLSGLELYWGIVGVGTFEDEAVAVPDILPGEIGVVTMTVPNTISGGYPEDETGVYFLYFNAAKPENFMEGSVDFTTSLCWRPNPLTEVNYGIGVDRSRLEQVERKVRIENDEIDLLKTYVYETKTFEGTLIEFFNGGNFNVTPKENGTVYVGGKNLIHGNNYTETKSGLTIKYEQGVVSISGTASDTVIFFIPIDPIQMLQGETYTFDLFPLIQSNNTISIAFYSDLYGTLVIDGFNVPNNDEKNKNIHSQVVKSGAAIYMRLYIPSGTNSGSFKVMATAGENPTSEFEYGEKPVIYDSEINIVTSKYICFQGTSAFDLKYLEIKGINYEDLEDKPKINGVEISGNKTSEDYNLSQSKDNSSKICIKYPIYKKKADFINLENPTRTSSIVGGTLYPALTNDIENGEIDPIFRYSVPMKVASDQYPLYKGVKANDARKLGYCVEFYVDDDFEIVMGDYARFVLVIDGFQVTEGVYSHISEARLHFKVSFIIQNNEAHHVEIWCYGDSTFFGAISGGIVTQYKQNRLRLIVDGDSIVEGSAVIGSEYAPFGCWASRLSQILDMDLINDGVGGSGYVKTGHSLPNMVDRFETFITPFSPDMLVVAAGLNDSSLNITEITPNINAYYEKVNLLSAKYVIVVSPYSNVVSPSSGNIAIADYLKSVSEKYQWPYVDLINGKTYDSLGNIISQYSNGGIMTDAHRSEWYSDEGENTDQTHPNAIGHTWIGKYMADQIFKICKDDFGITR